MMLKFDNSFYKLRNNFFEEVKPTKMPSPKLVLLNENLAKLLNFDENWLKSQNGIDCFSGRKSLKGSKPLSMVYAGHQFGNWVPRLGDGRAILLGETIDQKKHRWDIQLKGSGRTPFSRNGDGRATIGPALREYIISEYMNSINIPTTRALSVIMTGENVRREVNLPGAILTRVAKSHIRVGTFEYFASLGDVTSLKILSEYVIKRHYKNIKLNTSSYKFFLNEVIINQAKLIAKWMCSGFIHGVMNTDNTSIIGDTIDYGPCAFMDYYDPKIFHSYIDTYGRYCYINQPLICHWNLCQLANAILPLINKDIQIAQKTAQDLLDQFPVLYHNFWLQEMRKKFGFKKIYKQDENIISKFLEILEKEKLDFTLSFKFLENSILANNNKSINEYFTSSKIFKKWDTEWKNRLSKENMSKVEIVKHLKKKNPSLIPRNHIVESVLNKIVKKNDFTEFNKLIYYFKNPFMHINENENIFFPPNSKEDKCITFCGT